MGIAEESLASKRGPYDWQRSVGVVEQKVLRLDLSGAGFVTESGEVIPELEIAYETYGELSPGRDNAILVTPPLTADAHVAGFSGSADNLRSRGWWDDMVGPGKAIDTRRWFVICASMLGGSARTTGPSSIHPKTNLPWGEAFPDITIGDIVESQRVLLDALGIQKLYAVVGGSMGGMQALEWSLRHPDRVQRCVCIAAAASLSAQALAFDIVGRNAIFNDKNWTGGDYYPGKGPEEGLALARKIAHITYLSAEGMAWKFGRQKRDNDAPERFHTAFEVEKYLDHQGRKFVDRFDANAYLLITQAMDRFDLGHHYGRTQPPANPPTALEHRAWEKLRLREAFERSSCEYLIVALSSDWLFPAAESWSIAEVLLQLGKPVSFCELSSPHGHDGFLLEADQLDQVLTAFLADDAVSISSGSGADVHANPGERQLFSTPEDMDVIASMIQPGSRVLDIGCGDGQLLDFLRHRLGCRGEGVDIDLSAVIATMRRNLQALQGDADLELRAFDDGEYDYVVLNQTLQAVRKPSVVLNEILRVGKEAIVSFPNFGNWRCRLAVFLQGRMPKTRDLPYEWYETPNLHPFALSDFEAYCQRHDIEILEVYSACDSRISRFLSAMGFHNAAADRAVVRISRRTKKA